MNQISSIDQAAPRHSVEAEQQIIGALLTNNDLFYKISGFVKADHFFDPVHAAIFQTISDRIGQDELASPVTLRADLENHEGLAQLGGTGYLARLAGASIAAHGLVDYGKMIVEFSRRRALVNVCEDVLAQVGADVPAHTAMADLEIFLHQQEPQGEPRAMSLLRASTEAIQDVLDVRDGKSPSIPSGLASLDEAVGLRRGRYTMLAGTTSMGKTAAAQWIAYSAAKAGFGVGFVSLEMPERDLAARLNSIDSQVPYKAFERSMSENTMRKVVEAAKAQESLPIEIFSARVNDLASILSEAKKLKHKWQPNGRFQGLGMLVIDYIQLVKGKGTDFEVLSTVANDLKQVAKLLNVHVLALAQVGTKVMERDNPRPGLSDLRGSGDLGMAPDNVIFCHREEYYMQRRERPKDSDKLVDWMADFEASKNRMELIIGKARMGELGTVTVGCDMAVNRFWDIEATQEMEF